MTRPIQLQAHHQAWAEAFLIAKDQLQRCLGPCAIAIHHMGSTAVPGLLAKPTLDLLLEVRSLAELEGFRPALTALGYTWRGENGLSGRRYFHLGDRERSQHVHAYESGHSAVHRHLCFRDYLLAHPEAARVYSEAKQQALIASAGASAGYQAAKARAVQELEAAALAWASLRPR